VLLYTMDGAGTPVVEVDRASRPPDVDLTPEPREPSGLAYSGSGSMLFSGGHLAATSADSAVLAAALEAAESVTVELWIADGLADQDGPARILSLSRDSASQAFVVAREDQDLHVRLRTSITNESGDGYRGIGMSAFPMTAPTHVVFKFDGSDGVLWTYVDGEPVHVITHIGLDGSLGALDFTAGGDRLGMGDEFVDPRPWAGEIHRVAIYDRALVHAEIACFTAAGPSGP
jgi:hypothetical protein